MPLDPGSHANSIASTVEGKFKEIFKSKIGAKVSREDNPQDQFNFETGETIQIPTEFISYTSEGELGSLPSSLINTAGDPDQQLILIIAESILAAVRESIKEATRETIEYIRDNLRITLRVPTISPAFTFIAPSIPAPGPPLPTIPSSTITEIKIESGSTYGEIS